MSIERRLSGYMLMVPRSLSLPAMAPDYCTPLPLKPRDTINSSDLDRYDSFMFRLGDTQFVDMFPENGLIRVNVYEYPSNEIASSGSFAASEVAPRYFEQMKALADEIVPAEPVEG